MQSFISNLLHVLGILDLGCHSVEPSTPLWSTSIHFALTTLNTLISTHIPLPWLLTRSALIANSSMVQNRSMQKFATNQLMCACCTTLAKQLNNELAQSQKGATLWYVRAWLTPELVLFPTTTDLAIVSGPFWQFVLKGQPTILRYAQALFHM